MSPRSMANRDLPIFNSLTPPLYGLFPGIPSKKSDTLTSVPPLQLSTNLCLRAVEGELRLALCLPRGLQNKGREKLKAQLLPPQLLIYVHPSALHSSFVVSFKLAGGCLDLHKIRSSYCMR